MMLLAVVILSSAILGVTSLAGILTLYQVRSAGGAINSTKAIFAADAGIECALYRFSKDGTYDCGVEADKEAMSNDAEYWILEGPTFLRSTGTAGCPTRCTARSFELVFLE